MAGLIEPMEFIKYDKICDDVFTIGPNTVLRFNVTLSKITNEGKRYHFYKEFEYSSRANTPLVTIKRTYDYYLSIENVVKNKLTDEKAFIRIGPTEYCIFRKQLEEACSWFTDKKWKHLFSRIKGKLILMNPIPDSCQAGYPQGKFLSFSPTIINHAEVNEKMEPGVELALGNYQNTVTMNFDRLLGLYYTIQCFNMYVAAQNLIGYLGCPYGYSRINMTSYGGGTPERVIPGEEFIGNIDGVTNRLIGNNKNISSLE